MEMNGEWPDDAPRPDNEEALRRARLASPAAGAKGESAVPVALPAPGERRAPAPEPEIRPFARQDFARLARRPYLVAEYLLGGQRRLAANFAQRRDLWALAALLLVVSIATTVPYGLLSPARNAWKVAALLTGSLLICFPCLHLFAQYLGLRLSLEQTFALSLVLTGVAALFTLGFAPVIWFIDLSTDAGAGAQVTPAHLSVWLLAAAWALGIVQMARCIAHSRRDAYNSGALGLLIALWLPLLAFITYRMGRLLGIL